MVTYYRTYTPFMDLIGKQEAITGEVVDFTLLSANILCKVADWELKNKTCFETNAQFAKFFGCSQRTISRSISGLIKLGLLESKTSQTTWVRELSLTEYANSLIDK